MHQEVELTEEATKGTGLRLLLFEAKMEYQRELQSAKTQAGVEQEHDMFTASGSMLGHDLPAKLS